MAAAIRAAQQKRGVEKKQKQPDKKYIPKESNKKILSRSLRHLYKFRY